MHACMQGVKWLTPLLIKLMFSCRSRQTYLANVLIGCSNPPQGEIIQSKRQQDKFVKIKLSTEEHLFYHHFMSAGATQKPESLQLYCCLLLSFTCLQDHGSKKKSVTQTWMRPSFKLWEGVAPRLVDSCTIINLSLTAYLSLAVKSSTQAQ